MTMEHEPIRVGQVRDMGGMEYVVLDGPDKYDKWRVLVDGQRTPVWKSHFIHEDPVVGWSREHLPPPVVTANPAEVVQGERRYDGELYQVHSFCDDGLPNLTWLDLPDEPTIGHPLKEINVDRLVSRPGVTL